MTRYAIVQLQILFCLTPVWAGCVCLPHAVAATPVQICRWHAQTGFGRASSAYAACGRATSDAPLPVDHAAAAATAPSYRSCVSDAAAAWRPVALCPVGSRAP